MLKIGVLGAAAALMIASAPLAQPNPPSSGASQPPVDTTTGAKASSETPAPAPYSDSGTGLPGSDWTGDKPAMSASKQGTDTSARSGKSLAQCKAMPQDQRKADPDCRKTIKSNAPQ